MALEVTLPRVRSETLDLFLALQRELMGRFAWEMSLLPRPVVPEIAQFIEGVRAWQACGLDELPVWVATAPDPPGLVEHAEDACLRPGARQVADALTAAAPILRVAVAAGEPARAAAIADLDRLLPMRLLGRPLGEALGIASPPDSAPLSLPLHLVPLAPHSPGVGLLADRGRLVAAYADCRRLTGTALADSVLTVVGWGLLRARPGPDGIPGQLRARLPGHGPYPRRLRAVLTKLLVEATAGHLVRAVEPGHRPCVEVLGTAWRYPRLHSVVSRHWRSYLEGVVGRDTALSAITGEVGALSARWWLDHVDAAALAADFYLLEWMAADGDHDAGRVLSGWLPRLAGYLAGQLDPVIGAELGHYERARESAAAEPVRSFLRRVTDGDSRVAWPRARAELGQSRALELAERTFSGPGVEWGGEAWAPVAATLRRYIGHELPHAVFVDQCFTLEHNNGHLFDKYLDTERLGVVLDAQASGDLDAIAVLASAEARRAWHHHRDRRHTGYDARWLADHAAAPSVGDVHVGPVADGSLATPDRGRGPTAVGVGQAPPGSVGCGSAVEPDAVRPGVEEQTRPVRVRHRPEPDPEPAPPPLGGASATLRTALGPVRLRLWPARAPRTVENFVGLALGTRRWQDPATGRDGVGRFYDGTTFHRRVPGFLIQAGDRTGTGQGGPGYRIPDEIGLEARFDRPFLVAMANQGPDSGGSQFFITLAAAPHLDGGFTQFGELRDQASQEVVRAIALASDPVALRTIEASTW